MGTIVSGGASGAGVEHTPSNPVVTAPTTRRAYSHPSLGPSQAWTWTRVRLRLLVCSLLPVALMRAALGPGPRSRDRHFRLKPPISALRRAAGVHSHHGPPRPTTAQAMAGFVGKTADNRCHGRVPVGDAGLCPGGLTQLHGHTHNTQGARHDDSPRPASVATSQRCYRCRLCCCGSGTGQRRPECVRRPWLSLPGDGNARQPSPAGRDKSRNPRRPR